MTPAASPQPELHRRARQRRTALIAPHDLPDHATALHTTGYRLALVAAHDDTDANRRPGCGWSTCSSPTARPAHRTARAARPDNPRCRHPGPLSFPAGRFEREMHDLYGIVPATTHSPAAWYGTPTGPPAGTRCAATRRPARLRTADEPFPFLTVEGPGVYEIPVGPVHAGLIEPGHFRFSVVGETILKLKARLWFIHRGIEKLFQGRTPAAGIALAERISGDTAVGHALAYFQAVEDALGIDMPGRRASPIRAILLELERLYNHTTDIGALCNDVGHAILNTHAQRIRETLLRLNAETTGHRLLRGGHPRRRHPPRPPRPGELPRSPPTSPTSPPRPRPHPGPRTIHRHRRPDRGAGPRARHPRLHRPRQRPAHRRPPRPPAARCHRGADRVQRAPMAMCCPGSPCGRRRQRLPFGTSLALSPGLTGGSGLPQPVTCPPLAGRGRGWGSRRGGAARSRTGSRWTARGR